MIRRLLPFLCSVVLLASCGIGNLSSTPDTQSGATFPETTAIESWTLSNGLKVHYLPNQKPENHMELRVVVHTGSAYEKPGQEGIAHFMEHMVFNGTEAFPSGEVVKQLQLLGAGFGSHINAYTSTDATVYHFQVETKPETLDKAMHMLSDFVAKPLLLAEEIEKEKGVILAEKREGESPLLKAYEAEMGTLFKGSTFAFGPIGKEESIKNMSQEDFKNFWRSWYRPDRIELILTGDMTKDAVTPYVDKYFASIPKSVEAFTDLPEPVWSDERIWTEVTHRDVAEPTLSISWRLPAFNVHTPDGLKTQLMEQVLASALDKRLRELADLNPAVFTNLAAGSSTRVNLYAHLVSVHGAFKSGQFENGAKKLSEETKRFYEKGMDEKELEYIKEMLRGGMNSFLENISSKESSMEADNITDSIIYKDKIWTIDEQYKAMAAMLDKISLQDINSEIKNILIPQNAFGTLLRNPSDTSEVARAEIVFQNMNASALPSYEFKEPKLALNEFQMLPLPKTEEVTSIKTKTAVLSNGARVMVKHTDLDKDKLLLRVYIKGGPLNTEGRGFQAFQQMINYAGIQDLSQQELTNVLQKDQINVMAMPGDGGLLLMFEAPTAQTDKVLQVVHDLIAAPKYGERELTQLKDALASQEKEMLANPDALMNEEIKEMLSGKAAIKEIWSQEDRNNITLESLKTAQDIMLRAPHVEILAVGSLTETEMLQKITNVIGSLPAEKAFQFDASKAEMPFPAANSKVMNAGSEKKTTVSLRFPATSYKDMKSVAAYTILSDILTTKLFDILREEASGVYSPYVAYNMFPERLHTYMAVNFQTDPAETDKLKTLFWQTVEKLQKEGLKDADLQRAKLPMFGQIAMAKNMNQFWVFSIGSHFFPAPLDMTERMFSEMTKITIDDVNRAFKDSFRKEKVVELVRYPAE